MYSVHVFVLDDRMTLFSSPKMELFEGLCKQRMENANNVHVFSHVFDKWTPGPTSIEIVCNFFEIAFQSSTSSTQEHLCKLFKALESFYHPSNNGRYSVSTWICTLHSQNETAFYFKVWLLKVVQFQLKYTVRYACLKLLLIPDVS